MLSFHIMGCKTLSLELIFSRMSFAGASVCLLRLFPKDFGVWIRFGVGINLSKMSKIGTMYSLSYLSTGMS